MAQNIGEAQINPQLIQQLTPDVVSPQGKQQLFQTLGMAVKQKSGLDQLLGRAAQKIGGDFSSRIKNAETTVQKIAQKRLQGRDYNIDDVNDPYGARIVVDQKNQVPQAIQAVKDAAQKAGINVLKSENVTKGTYKAHHLDIQTPEGTRGEVQIMSPQQQLESMANHGLRAQFGETPPPLVDKMKDKQASLAKNVSNNKAGALSFQLSALTKANKDKPLDPRIVAQIMQKAV